MKRSYRRHRNPQGNEKKQKPFFKSNAVDKKKDDSFFQTKSDGIKINKEGDKDEKEADTVAAKVINRSASKETVQTRKKGIIQRLTLSTPKEDEKLGTAEQRMEKDKLIQEMPEAKTEEKEDESIQAKHELHKKEENEEEEMLQTSRIQRDHENSEKDLVRTDFSDKEKEEPSVAKQTNESEEEVDKKPSEREEEDLQTKSDMKNEEEPEEMIQTKPNQENEYTDSQVTEVLKRSKGKGRALSTILRREIEAHFKCDFKNVRIHTDQNSIWMCKQLNAQAFTNGYDIYFNEGKFNPDTSQGKQLLIHEMTHVVQQMYRSKK